MTGRPFRGAHSPGPRPPFAVDRLGGARPCPVLSTERLALGPLTLADWPAVREVMTGPRARYMGGPYTEIAAWTAFVTDVGSWGLTGSGGVAARASDGALVAMIWLNDLPVFHEPEMGWMTTAAAEGQGYATEAAAAVLDWVRAEVRPASLVSYVDRANPRSEAVARRLGAAPDPAAWAPGPEDRAWRHEVAA